MSDEIEITRSCGCVFCDLGLEPNGTREGRAVHVHHATVANKYRPYTICEARPSPHLVEEREE